jgi:hypothetical protein
VFSAARAAWPAIGVTAGGSAQANAPLFLSGILAAFEPQGLEGLPIGVGTVIAGRPLHTDGRDVVKPVSGFVTARVLVDWWWTRLTSRTRAKPRDGSFDAHPNFSRSLIDGGRVLCLPLAAPSTIGGLPAFRRAEPRPAPRQIRRMHNEVTVGTAIADVVRSLPSSQVPVVRTTRHWWHIS